MMKANLNSTISVPEGVLFQDVEGEAVLLDLNSGMYFGLDGVGTRMWTTLADYGQVRPAFQVLRWATAERLSTPD